MRSDTRTWSEARCSARTGRASSASFLKATAPTAVEGIEKYLGSGMIRGIGPVCRNVECTFYETVFDISVEEPIAIKSPATKWTHRSPSI